MTDKQLAESIIKRAMDCNVPVTVLVAILWAVFPDHRVVTRLG